jgi:uncharacterized protein YigE (DUF2233 family)
VFSRFLLVLLLLLPATAAAQDSSPQGYAWQTIGKGLSFTRLEVLEKSELVESVVVVRIDPNLNSFRVFHDTPRKLSEWQEKAQAAVLFNAGYFTSQGQPCGVVLIDGKIFGPLKNSAMRGMFVAEPRGFHPTCPGPPFWT